MPRRSTNTATEASNTTRTGHVDQINNIKIGLGFYHLPRRRSFGVSSQCARFKSDFIRSNLHDLRYAKAIDNNDIQGV
ncbi:hypothetical protein L596_029865 [Steinernema carpocapsae]|uniref:Uncharacterized protein n=1 Tax=Steinernema carpocapsae TaxID=34508 RepID=A0A4U5LR17_STECR|nr:hypothetical protein L596_029865 [Steinernema carpocapsae]